MSRAADRRYRVLGRAFVGFGGFALILGVWSGWASWAATRDAVRVWGVVVDLAQREPSGADRPGEGRRGRAPVVEYTVGGGTYRVRGHIYASPPSYEVRDSVAVLHPPGRPGEGRIDSFSERWTGPLLFGGGGLLFVVLGLGVLRHPPRLTRRSRDAMSEPQPRRPRWRRKRWIAAGLQWLLAAYSLSVGLACYCGNRNWLGRDWGLPYVPLSAAAELSRPTNDLYRRYEDWWVRMAIRPMDQTKGQTPPSE